MAERQTQSPPMMDQLRAAILNTLTAPIPQQAQRSILQQPSIVDTINQKRFEVLEPAFQSLEQNLPTPQQLGQNLSLTGRAAGHYVPKAYEAVAGMFGGGGQEAPQQTISQVQTQPQVQQPQEDKVEKDSSGKDKSKFVEMLVRMGVPLGAAIAGSINPNLLPEAAGLSSGFTSEIARQEELDIRRDKKMQDELEKLAANEDRVRRRIRASAEKAVEKSGDISGTPTEFLQKVKQVEEMMLKQAGLTASERAQEKAQEIRSGKPNGEYSVGQEITRGGRKLKVVGFDTDGEPLVEEVK